MSIIPILKEIHSFVAFIFLASTLVFVIYSISNFVKKIPFSSTQVVLSKMSFITSHIQLLLGILLWWFHGYAEILSTDAKSIMSDSAMRKMIVEHPMTNILAIILLTIGYISIKKSSLDESKHKKGFIYFGIAVIFILAMIPYKSWFQN